MSEALIDQQKRALDKLVDDRYNKIHEDAFNRIMGFDATISLPSRMRDIIQRLWWDRNRYRQIIGGLETQVKDALFTCQIQQKQIQTLAAEIKKMRGSKGNYGKV